ncbi:MULTISPECIES: hypothetical protein [unclassified Leptolyngbya]|uniref:hypothetical protein n=1 Tax=unclassified Leptolyngbya TaxID=2650499 RepID=UPI001688AEA4|nr:MULTISPECIES: hypothetical protein [unclassified Leptolyngbya]MBD1913735.1 hypothetical protein [Leptolyngbya sp. FACHB-8]MBD2153230.1 hypothetical protein [Leptolyngbya sp. FACHB-16]
MSLPEIFQLAWERECVLKAVHDEWGRIYWVENQHFISRPYPCLEELATLIQRLPSQRSLGTSRRFTPSLRLVPL